MVAIYTIRGIYGHHVPLFVCAIFYLPTHWGRHVVVTEHRREVKRLRRRRARCRALPATTTRQQLCRLNANEYPLAHIHVCKSVYMKHACTTKCYLESITAVAEFNLKLCRDTKFSKLRLYDLQLYINWMAIYVVI